MCFQLKSCCCCISLEVGTQVIGIGSTILSASVAVLYGTSAALMRRHEPHSKTLFYYAVAAFSVIHCLLSCMLTYGAFTRRPRLILPWVVAAWGQSILLMTLSILGASVLLYRGQASTDTNAMITVYFCCSLLLFYCACVVSSRRAQLSRPDSDAGRLMRPGDRHAFTYV